MAALVLTDAAPWIGAYAFQGITNQLALDMQAAAPESTVFGATHRSYSPGGLKGIGLQIEGFWDAPVDLGVLGTLLGASFPVTVAQAASAGAIAYLFRGVTGNYELGAPVGDNFRFRAGAAGNGILARGMLMENGTRTSTGNGTGQQLGALSATQKLYSALHVTAASGSTPTLDIIIQSDDNAGFSSPTTRATLAQITGATSVWTEIAGAITDTYWRYVFTIGGGSPSFTIAGAMGIASA